MRTANPALNTKTFERFDTFADDTQMTLMGTVHKVGLLLLILMVPAIWIWGKVYSGGVQNVGLWMMVGFLGGLVVALITFFKPTLAPITTPIYAALEGLALGAISALVEMRFPGIVIQAVALTFGTLFCLLMAYRSGLIQATENFKLGVVAATGGIALVYLATIILGFFNVTIPFIHGSGNQACRTIDIRQKFWRMEIVKPGLKKCVALLRSNNPSRYKYAGNNRMNSGFPC